MICNAFERFQNALKWKNGSTEFSLSLVFPNRVTYGHFGSNKGGFMGETDKINLKLDKLTANFEELCKTVKFLNDKYDELLS